MKTSMRKERVGLRKRIRYLFPAVILLCGLALFAFSCDDDDNSPSLPPPPTVEKVVLVFGVDQGEGTLSAKPVPSDKVSETVRSEEHTSELQSRQYLVCRLLLEKKKKTKKIISI